MSTLDYTRKINEAKSMNLIDWDATSENRYERTIMQITIAVWLHRPEARWYWKITHAHGRVIDEGESDSRELAKLEALAYAQNWARNAHATVNA